MKRRLGIAVARLIVAGDVHRARLERAMLPAPISFTVAECRAIAGACREARRRYGCELSLAEFLL